MKVVDQMPVVLGIDDRRRVGGKFGKIAGTTDLPVGFIRIEEMLEGRRIGNLPAFDQGAA